MEDKIRQVESYRDIAIEAMNNSSEGSNAKGYFHGYHDALRAVLTLMKEDEAKCPRSA